MYYIKHFLGVHRYGSLQVMAKRISNFDTVNVSELRHSRRGKHHAFMQEILKDLELLADRKAMKIPLDKVPGVSLVNLRAAITRATSSLNIRVRTYSDGNNLFVWKQRSKD
jgi:hypothetical protein